MAALGPAAAFVTASAAVGGALGAATAFSIPMLNRDGVGVLARIPEGLLFAFFGFWPGAVLGTLCGVLALAVIAVILRLTSAPVARRRRVHVLAAAGVSAAISTMVAAVLLRENFYTEDYVPLFSLLGLVGGAVAAALVPPVVRR